MARDQVTGSVPEGAGLQKYESMKAFFSRKEVIEHLNAVIPKVANADRLLRIALGVVRQNTDLLKCSQGSLLSCIVQSLQMGLSLDPGLKQAHLVPFWNERKKQYEATFIPGYQGYLDLARRAGQVSSVSAHCVYKSDHFIVRYGTDKMLEHIPNDQRPEDDPIRGAYVVYYFKNGEKEPYYMPWVDIQKRMNVSKAKATGPWKDWQEEMAVKTVIRHSIKYVGISADLARAASLEERTEIGETQEDILSLPEDLTAGIEPPETEEQQKFSYQEMVKANIPDAEIALWNQFVEETAKANGKPIQETQLRLKNDFTNALNAYGGWKAQHTPPPVPPSPPPEGKKKNPGPSNPPDKPKDNPGKQVKCPNSGEMKDISFCKEKCPYSEGCPEL